MKPYIYNLILGFLALVVVIIPFTGEVYSRKASLIKSFTARGWTVLFAFIISILVNYFKDLQVDKDDKAKDRVTKSEKHKDDPISRKRNDESNAKIVNTFTSSLAKYNLRYDSTQNQVLRFVRDSAKKNIRVINRNNPEFDIIDINLKSIKNDTATFSIGTICKQAAGYKINLFCYVVLQNKAKTSYEFVSSLNPHIFHDLQMPGDKDYHFEMFLNKTPKNWGRVFLLFKGNYENLEGKKFNYKKLLLYDIDDKNFGMPFSPYDAEVLAFYADKGIIF